MILNFKHKGLQLFWEKDNSSKLPADQRNKIRLLLDTINDASEVPDDFLPFRNCKIHSLSGDLKGYWSLTVKENWRIIFKFDGKDAYDIDYLDYH